ncbi:MAG: SBBP repeat-containing protein [Ignavibacteria bacterium]|nr:SBBP repeat-containing protein [Ignavibacteria bacterium]
MVQLKSDGTVCDYTTYLGGNNFDDLSGLAVNSAGDVYVTGSTTSNDFPMSPTTTPSLSKQIIGLYDAVVLAINTNSVSLQPARDTTVCAFIPLTLSNNASGIGTLRYVWSDEAAGNTTIGTTSEITFTPTVSTTIFLSVKDDNNRPKYAKYKITVKPIPTITTIDEKRTCVGNTMTLTSIAGDPKNIMSWYDDVASTTPVGNSSTFITPNLTKSVTYFVEQRIQPQVALASVNQ